MKSKSSRRATVWSVLLFSNLILAAQPSLHAAGVVTNCTEADLRAALAEGGTVTFDCDGTITLASQLTIDTDTTLDATGHSITLSGGGTTRVLAVASGVKLTLKRVTISDGFVSGEYGGGIRSFGEVTISDGTFANNTAVNGPAPFTFGGAIDHRGTRLVITGTTFIGNTAGTAGSGGGGALNCLDPSGGPVPGNIAITNCTFFANGWVSAVTLQQLGLPATFVNCTFASNNNRAILVFAAGLPGAAGVRVINSIIAYTVGGDGVQGIEDWGHNLSSDNSASLTNATTLKNTDPLLGLLTDNGGPTPTMGLLYGSPAIDTANDAAAPGTDQRGVARPTRSYSDIGAFEGSVSPVQSSTVHFIQTNFTAGESQGAGLVQVERTGSSAGTAGITVSATAGTATAGADFAPANIALVFAEGEMQKSVPVTILNDTAPETNETVFVSLSNAVGTVDDSPSIAQLTIIDDDQAYMLTDYTDGGLRAAVANGGWIQFPSNGTITLTSPISVSQFTVLDASGHNVVLSGGNAVRLFDIIPGAPLTLMNLTIANGRNQGFNGATGTDGGQGSGGAINVDNGSLNLIGCRIWTNTVVGGAGGNGNPNGSGGPALGGAIYVSHGTLNATNSEFVGNLAIGGPGGTHSVLGGANGSGGAARGGAVASTGGTFHLDNCSFRLNAAAGGRAPQGSSNDGTSGEASGGAWFNNGGTAVVTTCSFVFNNGSTPNPRVGSVSSGSGGTVRGGGICNVAGRFSIADTELLSNQASGGGTPRLGTAGPGQGGGICNLAVLDVTRCLFQNNSANGGNNGYPAGDGLGGAIFNGGELSITQTEFGTNTAQAGQGYNGGNNPVASGIARGGAILTTSVLVLSESTLSGNSAFGAAGGLSPLFGPFPGYPAYGGAIYSTGGSYLTNNTLAANVASGGPQPGSPFPPGSESAGGDAYGGGLYQTGGTAFLLNNTVAGNAAQGGTGYPNGYSYGGGIANQSGVVTLLNTIVANSLTGSNGFGTLTDAGHNLSSDASCAFSSGGSLNNTDPKLSSLGDYGGPTATIPLLASSPAIEGGDNGSFPPTDQRGHVRPYGLGPDIGAFEFSPSTFLVQGIVSGATLKEEVSVTAGATTVSTTNHGNYSLSLTQGAYSITPQSPNYLFVPTNRPVTVGPDQLGVNFKAYRWNALSLDDFTNGVLHLVFAGTNGQTQRLQASTNLVHWDSVATNAIGPTNYFEIFIPVSGGIRFYRTIYR